MRIWFRGNVCDLSAHVMIEVFNALLSVFMH